MKVWLIGLGLSLLCSVFAVDGFDGDIQQVAGTWHVSAVATECKCMLKHKDRMKMMVVTLTPQEADSVTMDTTIPMPNGCKKISMKFTKNENGEYKHSCGLYE
ncbi:glycodelin [Tiliqua scincoides]|uniref:glycodelin n=1 Tax=Tiliqua scincoides TaxID=71010 RepID=UPI003462168D